jgi:hypothetical protein
VTGQAAITGDFGLQAVLDDHRPIFVVDDTPAEETAYQVRFYFDPNGLSSAGGNPHVLLVALSASGPEAFRLELRSLPRAYEVRLVVARDHGRIATPWSGLTDAPHAVEIGWRAASTVDTHDGALQWWIDGTQMSEATKLDNDTRRVGAVRWGAVSGVGGARGTLYFDAFVSTRGLPIGP